MGFAFSYTIALTVALNVTSLQKTLSPSFTPASFTARCNADVPHESGTAYLHPTFSQTMLSIALRFAPSVDTQLDSIASVMYLFSSPCIVGVESQILLANGSIFIFHLFFVKTTTFSHKTSLLPDFLQTLHRDKIPQIFPLLLSRLQDN